ncbi:MAG TPA: xanthine dehydrogenase family protein molybdopterin-binding subunit [Caulobacteraceae bacterium]|nr:xanthine dehydrogenase family protein molybdopterin-binding subunit [Caulobacteraceae bacterium]
MNAISKIKRPSRRAVVITAGVVGGGALVVGLMPKSLGGIMAIGAESPHGPFGPFIKISPDNSVTVMNKHQDSGQANHAGLAALVAEELDADWDKVSVEPSVANAKLYANTLFGVQGTGGSTAMANSWIQYRQAGAAARAMLVQAAATRWGVSPASLTTKDSVVTHAASGRSAPYGDLIAEAAQVPPPQAPVLKNPKDFTLIGTARIVRKDTPAKSTGKARYTQDVHLPDMLVAMVQHSPRFGGRVASFDATAAKQVPGVVDAVQLPTGVAVIASSTFAARQGRDALRITWNDDKAEKRSTDAIVADYHRIATGQGDVKAQPFETRGDATSAFSGPLFEAAYDFPYLAHAAMEPMNCVAQVDGMRVRLTFGSQIQTLDQINTAMVVGTLPGAVEIETLPAGGSFGRRGNNHSDYVVEAVHIAKHVGGFRPVKLVWTREDDMTGGLYRPMAYHALSIRTDADGFPAAWRHRVVTQSIMKGGIVGGGFDDSTVEGAKGSPYLDATPVVDGQVYMPDFPVTVLWWRSVGATHTAFVMEHTIDQLARRAGKDPADYRRALYTRAGASAARHRAVLDLACEKAGWGASLPAGTARGVAVHASFGSVVAQVAEVTMQNGEPRVGRVVCAVDCGTAIAPSLVAQQMEGGVCYGLSAVLYGQITLKDGIVEQTNFDAHRVLRMNEAPHVETYILPSTNAPTGAGEPGTPVIAPAVANALLVLNGTPTSSLPFVKST